ncbi:MAG: type II toxin-antitoxin system prevent-host-death family antitoxin [Thermodesulfobacteriota bacterium]|nr:type II toxin-antitoxin system prevent-host-death family antitoxin [Thermodesulfobacteriota bacterium]
MQTINISEFRANLLKYLEIASSGEQIAVTSNSKLLATVIPPINQKELARQQLKELSSTAQIHDITSPIDSEWDASL